MSEPLAASHQQANIVVPPIDIGAMQWRVSFWIGVTAFGLAFYSGIPFLGLNSSLLSFCLLTGLLVTISTHDLYSNTIPLRLNELLLISGLGVSLLSSGISIRLALDGAVVGWIAVAGYNKITQWVSQHRALGQGDELLALGLGAWLGPEVFMTVLFKSLLLSLWFLILIRILSSKWLKVIPLAPMLALPALVTVLHSGSTHYSLGAG